MSSTSYRKTNIAILLTALIGVSAATTAKEKQISSIKTDVQNTEVVSLPEDARTQEELENYFSKLNALDKARAKSWRLSEKDYSRYKLLKETSPRAIWTPNIDPITLLGAESRTEQERMKYARLFNQLEIARTQKDIAFGNAQNEDLKRLSPNSNAFKSYLEQRKERRINYMNMSSMSQGGIGSDTDYQSTSYIFYIDLMRSCDAKCAKQVSGVIQQERVDFFFINATTDEAIIGFAREHHIPSDKVRTGTFTFNYADEDKVPTMRGAVLAQKLTGNDDAEQIIF